MKTTYSTTATATDGRMGEAKLSDSKLIINMQPPSPSADGNNPEQLFAMAFGACFDGDIDIVQSKNSNHKFDHSTLVEVDLLVGEHNEHRLALKIHVIASNTDLSADEVQKVVDDAFEMCAYANTVREGVVVEVTSEIK
ncbi:Ohr family peroxiredoxin [Psychrobacter sp.]|uniref:Ohr family peroxiredoxin n=1 Tax=Psychrobacter sp. TaxID=56811 RepID=UPI0025E35E4D|nr:Ohr family peroxiredoxin [Psychrobacter sp.]